MTIVEAVNNVLRNYIKLCYVYFKFELTKSKIGSSTQIFKFLTFEVILFIFSRINLRKKNKKIFSCGALLLYVVHEPVQGTCSALCACNSHPNFRPNICVFANLPVYRKLIHDNISLAF